MRLDDRAHDGRADQRGTRDGQEIDAHATAKGGEILSHRGHEGRRRGDHGAGEEAIQGRHGEERADGVDADPDEDQEAGREERGGGDVEGACVVCYEAGD